MLQPLLDQMFKMACLCMDTSPKMSSPFANRRIDNCLLYARPHLDTAAVFFQMFQKSFKVIFFYPFAVNSFISLLAPKPWNLYRFLKNKFSKSNCVRARRSRTTTQQSPQRLQWDATNSPPNCLFPLDDHHSHIIHPSFDRTHSLPQTASGSVQPFCHFSTVHLLAHRHTDRQIG